MLLHVLGHVIIFRGNTWPPKWRRKPLLFLEGKLWIFCKFISEEYCNLLAIQLRNRKIGSSMIRESRTGSLKITLEYHLNVDKISVQKSNKISIQKASDSCHFDTSPHTGQPAASPNKKHKIPSRRRDRKRFYMFLDRKKQEGPGKLWVQMNIPRLQHSHRPRMHHRVIVVTVLIQSSWP